MHLAARSGAGLQLGGDGFFGPHKTGVALEVGQLVALQLELRVTALHLGGVQHLVGNVVALGAGDGAAHEVALAVVRGDAVARRQDQPAGAGEHLAPGAFFQFAPDAV